MEVPFHTYARGKLLLSSEYAVLDGALALALPVRYGQTLEVRPGPDAQLEWTALDADGAAWLEVRFSLPGLHILSASDPGVADTLRNILLACRAQEPDFLSETAGLRVRTALDFPRQWGLGSSSTLIAALGRWSGADPYRVLADTLGGSGYDLACAYADGPILFHLEDGKSVAEPIAYLPPFRDQLYFVYLGRKQDSREGIRRYRALAAGKSELIAALSDITRRLLAADTLPAFEALLAEHEQHLSAALQVPRARDTFFSDYMGEIKSLGAWGGDFVLATAHTTPEETRAWFQRRGYPVCLSWEEMVG